MTLQEAWNGRKSSVTHLKIFFSISYLHVDDQITTKLDDSSKKMIFVIIKFCIHPIIKSTKDTTFTTLMNERL